MILQERAHCYDTNMIILWWKKPCEHLTNENKKVLGPLKSTTAPSWYFWSRKNYPGTKFRSCFLWWYCTKLLKRSLLPG